MANDKLVFLLLLHIWIVALETGNGVNGQCATLPSNLAVYDGTRVVIITCNSPTKVSYSYFPTTDELKRYKITDFDGNVTPELQDLFSVNDASLIVKIAQGTSEHRPLSTAKETAGQRPISTAGLYIISYRNSSVDAGAKIVVVLKNTECKYTAINSTKTNLTCSLTYADGVRHPIDAKMTWTFNGNDYTSDIPRRTFLNPYFTSTSFIIVETKDIAKYQCTVTFMETRNIESKNIAGNPSEFSASCASPSVRSVGDKSVQGGIAKLKNKT